MLPQPKEHIPLGNLHSADLTSIGHRFLFLRGHVSLIRLGSSPPRRGSHLIISKRLERRPVLPLPRPLRALHEARVHRYMRAAWEVDAFGRVHACWCDDFAEHGVVEGRVEAEGLAEDGIVEGHLLGEGRRAGDLGEDLCGFDAEG